MEKRIGVIAILIELKESVPRVNAILSEHGQVIVGRMGIPYKEKNINVISVIVDGTTDDIGAMAGKLGKLDGVMVKTVLSKK